MAKMLTLKTTARGKRLLESVIRRVVNMRLDIPGGTFTNSPDAITGYIPMRGHGGDGGDIMVSRFLVQGGPDVRMGGADYLVCKSWDGTTEGGQDVCVAKPWELQKTPFDGKTNEDGWLMTYGSFFSYADGDTRTASKDDETEEFQTINRPYYGSDEIFAITGVGGHGMVHPDDGSPIIWTDLNLGARRWAVRCSV